MDAPESNREIIGRIKKLRVDIDRQVIFAMQLKEMLNKTQGTEEIVASLARLAEARMWLGASLEKLGYGLPEEHQDKYRPAS